LVLGILSLGLLLPGGFQGYTADSKPATIRLNQKTKDDLQAGFEVHGLAQAALAQLAKADLKEEQWAALFAVRVKKAKGDLPAILGSYEVKDKVLRFRPGFPLVRGLRYRAVFDPSKAPGGIKLGGKRLVAEFLIPKPAPAALPVVKQVYPTAGKLPENLLKFYIHFSAPMSQGDVYQHIKLLGAGGKPVKLPFLELRDELWDREGKRLTLLFDPGRIKRGLKPREELGPVLEEGKTYTLVIDRRWEDAEGNPLKESYRKTFKVLAPIDHIPITKTWKLRTPMAGATGPLTVTFPRPMDHALLHRVVWVTDARGKTVPGTVSVTDEETRWHFTPKQPWRAGTYHLVADTTLEDLAGNNLTRPFEVDVFRRVQKEIKSKMVKLPFQVRAAGKYR
jgi:hypothetical protein